MPPAGAMLARSRDRLGRLGRRDLKVTLALREPKDRRGHRARLVLRVRPARLVPQGLPEPLGQ